MDNWKVGDIAICVNNDLSPDLKLYAEYCVQGVGDCPYCGDIGLDVGHRNNGVYLNQQCLHCGFLSGIINDVLYSSASRFVKKRSLDNLEINKEVNEKVYLGEN